MSLKQCEWCNQTFEDGGRFCSVLCRQTHNSSKRQKVGVNKKCKICGTSFYVHQSDVGRRSATYCSYKCAGIARGQRSTKIKCTCKSCKSSFEVYPSTIKNGGGKYCCRKCANLKGVKTRKCSVCAKLLKTNQKKYCSRKCYGAANSGLNNANAKPRIYNNCEICNKKFRVKHAERKKGQGRFCSRKCFAVHQASAAAEKIYTVAKGGKRKDLGGLYVRSSWEANYARYLNYLLKNRSIQSWEYEPDVFDLSENDILIYRPDFKVVNLNNEIEYHEVKGWLDKKSKKQISRFRALGYTLMLVDKKRYSDLYERFCDQIPHWEHLKPHG